MAESKTIACPLCFRGRHKPLVHACGRARRCDVRTLVCPLCENKGDILTGREGWRVAGGNLKYARENSLYGIIYDGERPCFTTSMVPFEEWRAITVEESAFFHKVSPIIWAEMEAGNMDPVKFVGINEDTAFLGWFWRFLSLNSTRRDSGEVCFAPGCDGIADFLCDFPVGQGKTCDLPLCRNHVYLIAPETHLCPIHHKIYEMPPYAGIHIP